MDQLAAEGIRATPCSGISTEPYSDEVNAVADEFRATKCNVIVALGGGSTIDFAKALSIALSQGGDVWEFANLSERQPRVIEQPLIPVVALPTTAGTGAEITPYAVLTNRQLSRKGTIQDSAIIPRVALVDPDFAQTLPPSITAATGLDALSHALESAINISKYSPLSDVFALEALRRIFEWLPVAHAEPLNERARFEMSYSALVAGLAISGRGTTAVHAIAETLSGLTGIAHGLSVAASLVPVLEATLTDSTAELALVSKGLRLREDGLPDSVHARGLVENLRTLVSSLQIPWQTPRVAGYGDSKELCNELVSRAVRQKARPLAQHPMAFSEEQLNRIAEDVIVGRGL